ncbi:aldehyde ferredoxin oxidoreductase family protein [Caldivirga maquilingensis]|uniref:Aldehyde ferredoxin oxidoreductase n=1 Tax=Caldivirga maquilingensis (strain ATCC 700844 / DSM 13496 / JCM 10307 / IC-167) TaxID=397948 RepID=A8M9H8_CALMQ|nr:aldehyde ferredoxin oxidoreductase family protein [Caldivirga maquilingensis]ABW00859.1 Aldehyde ferredoxin oxidoreductase [Caldivirga maquilingensis IC-167]
MRGWTGRLIRVNLSLGKYWIQDIDPLILMNYIGGRGLAIKLLWDELPRGVDPLSPLNKLIIATGPLTGYPGPNTGKLVIAAKSPLTGGYGDGNIGSWASVHLRKAGFDAMIIEGASSKPVYIYMDNDKVDLMPADDLWGLDTFTTEDKLRRIHGSNVGMLIIGPAGENMVRFATVIAQRGRSGGRPGMGAVMGSKRLKAIVIRGTKPLPQPADPALSRIGVDADLAAKAKQNYGFWLKQGTTATVEWAQEASVLPAFNYREGQFDYYDRIGGVMVEKNNVTTRSCPNCVMPCGHVVKDAEDQLSELDYENIAMLGSNIGVGNLQEVAYLNRLADMMGMDTISLGSALGWAMEATERGLIKDGLEWGDYKRAAEVTLDIAHQGSELGRLLGLGVKGASSRIGGGSGGFAMHVKGLEVSAYDCHAAPGMALAFATSPIGAHHKDAWVISWEVQTNRFAYSRDKVLKVIELQNIRGGWFEVMVGCRLPWVEIGLELDWYWRMYKAATGMDLDLEGVANRVYTLIRAFWIREYGGWSRDYDTPPIRWFKDPLTKGPLKGAKLDYNAYQQMLNWYYEARGWDERGIPRRSTLRRLGLGFIEGELSKVIELTD